MVTINPSLKGAIALLCFVLPLRTAAAQSEISVEPDTLILKNETEVVVKNITDDPVQIDSLRFSAFSWGGWYVDIKVADTTYYELYYIIGSIYPGLVTLFQTISYLRLRTLRSLTSGVTTGA